MSTIAKRRVMIPFLAVISIILGCLLVVGQSQLEEDIFEDNISNHFNNWNDPEYEGWVCRHKVDACMDYLKTQNINCMKIYGKHPDNHCAIHVWLLLDMNGIWKEFECNNLNFQQTSLKYENVSGEKLCN